MDVECVDLRERFGRQYRVRNGESYPAARRAGGRVRDPWLAEIVCRHGHVYPFGGNLLAASVDGFPKVAGRLRRLDCCQIWQDGDHGELTVLFDVANLPEVARIMRPRRRRQLSPEHKADLARRLRGRTE